MGIIDTIKGFFVTREKAKSADVAIAAFKAAMREGNNYNQASLKAFYALETIGEVYAEIRREEHITAREYVKQLEEAGVVSMEEVMPIIESFEIAKYSEHTVDIDALQQVENTLDTVAGKVKSGTVASTGGPKRKKARKRKPRKGRTTGAGRRKKSS